MTAPLPNELKPEVVEALEFVDQYIVGGDAEIEGRLPVEERHLVTLASYIESLHAERAGAVEGLPEGCPETAFFGPGSGLVFNPEYGDLHDVLVEIHPVGTRARLQASPREWDAEKPRRNLKIALKITNELFEQAAKSSPESIDLLLLRQQIEFATESLPHPSREDRG